MNKKPAKRLNLNKETVAGLKMQVATAIKAGLRPPGSERTNFYSPLPNVCC
jgi:hypothetical protein